MEVSPPRLDPPAADSAEPAEKRTTARGLARLRVHSRFLASAAWLLVSTIVGRLAVLVATVVVSRILAPDSFGRVAVLMTAITVTAGFSGLGVGVTLTKRVAEVRRSSPELAGKYVGVGMTATLAGGLCVTIAYIAAASPLAHGLLRTSRGTGAILASAGAVLATAMLTTSQGALAGLESFRRVAVSQALQSGLPAVGLIVGAELSGVNGALGGFSAGNIVAMGVSLAMVRGAFRDEGIVLQRSFELAVWRNMVKLGASAFIAFLVVTAAFLVGQILLAYRAHGYAQVALFNVSYRWQLALLLTPTALASVLLPTMTRLGSEGRGRQSADLFMFNARMTTVLTALPAAVLALAAPVILGLSGSFYGHNTTPLRLLMLAAIPSALNNTLSSASLSLGAIRAWVISDVALAAAFFATALALIPAHGATGLAFAYLAGYVATDAALVRPVLRRLRDRRLDGPREVP